MRTSYPGCSITFYNLPSFTVRLHRIVHTPDLRLWGLNAIASGEDDQTVQALADSLNPRFLPAFCTKVAHDSIRAAARTGLMGQQSSLLVRLPDGLNPAEFDLKYLARIALEAGLSPDRVFLRFLPASIVSRQDLSRFSHQLPPNLGCPSLTGAEFSAEPTWTSSKSVIKLGATVVAGIDHRPKVQRLVAEFVENSRHSGVFPIADGVSTECEYRQLARLGVTVMQGPWFAEATAPACFR